MGYTHYFKFAKAPKGQAWPLEKTYRKAIAECTKVIKHYSETFGGLSGFSAHAEIGRYGGLAVNGSARVGGCETFELPEHFNETQVLDGFVKTNRLPYDTVVTACLIILKHRLGDVLHVSSDGRQDDWNDGLTLAKHVLKLKNLNIPDGINKN